MAANPSVPFPCIKCGEYPGDIAYSEQLDYSSTWKTAQSSYKGRREHPSSLAVRVLEEEKWHLNEDGQLLKFLKMNNYQCNKACRSVSWDGTSGPGPRKASETQMGSQPLRM